MRLIARKGKFVGALLTVILSGSLFTRVAFADESKTVPAGDEQPKGERSGFATTMASWSVSVTHRFNELVSVRPEVRYEYAFSARPGTTAHEKGS